MKREERDQLAQLENLSLYFLENLHAKCFFNEETMVITSFNMLVSSMENKEMGVLITVKDDPNCFNEAREEARRIVQSATKDTLRETREKGYSYETKVAGYCIRCGAHIDLDLRRPFCRDCFSEWVEWENPDYPEHFCHTCGRESITTFDRPKCDSCYRQSKTSR